jgi:prephenate dehydrogenase
MTPAAPRALVAGLGLIGGSIGMALRARGWQIAYLDPNVEIEAARRAGAADDRASDIGAHADLVIIATPVDVAVDLIRRMPSAAATSVSSVMRPLRSAADERRLPFVAGHPMAGSQERGLTAARGDLFKGRTWFVDRDDPLVARVVADCGAEVDRVDGETHDRAVALTSHLPQILSTALAAAIAERPGIDRFAGGGLSTFLRLAGSDASVWSSVLAANRDNIEGTMDELMRIVRRILDGDGEPFDRAKQALGKLP